MTRLAIVFGLFAAACGGKGDETPPAASGSQVAAGSAKPAVGSGSAAAAGSAGSGSGSGSAVASAPKDPDVPTPEDFDEDATTRITEKNVETEVKALEKEIGDN